MTISEMTLLIDALRFAKQAEQCLLSLKMGWSMLEADSLRLTIQNIEIKINEIIKNKESN